MSTPSAFRHPRSLPLRLWHWSNALVLSGLLGTVLLRKTFLSWRDNSALIEAKVAKLGETISPETAVAVAKTLRDPMWAWHYPLGQALAALLVARLGIALWERAQGARPAPATDLHVRLVSWLYRLFYVWVGFLVITGLSLYWREALGLAGPWRDAAKEAHELAMWGMAAFVPLHVVGVVVAELRGERGLVSGMIHGDDDIPV